MAFLFLELQCTGWSGNVIPAIRCNLFAGYLQGKQPAKRIFTTVRSSGRPFDYPDGLFDLKNEYLAIKKSA